MVANEFVISSHGVRSPRIIYGTAWKNMRTQELVRTAIQRGFRGIDTACQPKHYYEAGVGAAVAACLNDNLRRGDLYLQTKFTPLSGHDPKRIPYDPSAPPAQQVAQSFKTSMRNLQTDYVDCLILHSALPDPSQMSQVWGAMEQLFHAGGARQLGISNCYSPASLEMLYQVAKVKPAVVQNRFYAETGYDREIREFCRRREILYQSFWTLTANPQLLAHGNVAILAAKYARTPAQILFRYLTQNDIVPLTGTTSATHMREDLEIFDFQLTPGELQAVTNLL
ncbi:MAG: aldo/keto reductase family protein [Steroidobacteraceae bacterium]|jgi:diketogulonate reductase-like aldo/keto reductase